ncbi:MAG: class II fructose-1,6-bisphosphate aldolase [Acholeplasmatales bacterium]|jgi:fructose-bisphosphate aldolase class II|nr:class II fructose-1,6-bisphosphate aldolase [Acholeplasmatales bacterium]
MLVSLKEICIEAGKKGWAVPQININNLEWTKAVLEKCEELHSPVILGVSEGAAKYMGGFSVVANLAKSLHDSLKINVPVVIHLDHGTYEGSKKALEAGFTSIMFDGSSYPIDQNIAYTKEIVALCHQKNVSVEAEVGAIGGEEDGVTGNGEVADPKECAILAGLGIDILAAGIGNIHGRYPANWKGLNFETLAKIKAITHNIPLVLHGGSGIPEDQIKKAIGLGVAKINVNTECQLAFAQETRKYILEGKDLDGKGFDPRKLLAPGVAGIKKVVEEKVLMFGSNNRY